MKRSIPLRSHSFATLKDLEAEVEINSASESIRINS
jgi:hypothetical protein